MRASDPARFPRRDFPSLPIPAYSNSACGTSAGPDLESPNLRAVEGLLSGSQIEADQFSGCVSAVDFFVQKDWDSPAATGQHR